MVGRPGLSPHEWILPLRKEEGVRWARGAGRSITLSDAEGQASLWLFLMVCRISLAAEEDMQILPGAWVTGDMSLRGGSLVYNHPRVCFH
ncbi:hypothetical protein O3P69_017836 [Scylla paramamosain]|uniref:Uncharacterized protein n=1 Tax=Scylla paramamosain TaxID=85552 RepID=A0AAW0TGG2_SCYPA